MPGWRVVNQQQREDLTTSGTFHKVWDVTYETSGGTRGTVTIPERLYEESYVRAEIERKVATTAAIEGMQG